METSRSRRHSVGVPGRSELVLHRLESASNPTARGSTNNNRLIGIDGRQQEFVSGGRSSSGTPAGLKSVSPPAAASSSSKRRRRPSAGGRRRSKGGSSDFSFSPYQPMIIETKSSSVSPRPRRASAPIPPASLLRKDGERQQGTAGPTLEQCLVLPPGLALKVDELLSRPLSKSGEAAESEGGGGGGGGGGVDGDDLRQVASTEGKGGDLEVERGQGGVRDGDDRAIMSTYTFEPSNSHAAVTNEEAVEHAPATDELVPAGDAVAVSDESPRDACHVDAEEIFVTPAEETCNLADSPASGEGIGDEAAGASASAATTLTVGGDEPPEEAAASTAGEEPDVKGSVGGEDESACDLVGDDKASDDAEVVVDSEGQAGGGSSGGFGDGDVADPYRAASPLAVAGVEPKGAALMDGDAAADGFLAEVHHEEERALPQAMEIEELGRNDPAAGSRGPAVETDHSSPNLEAGDVLSVGRDGAVMSGGGGGVAAAAGGDEDDCDNDRHVSEEDKEEGTEAALVEHDDGGAAGEECGAGKVKVGSIQKEEISTSAATEASDDSSGDVVLGEGNEDRNGARASKAQALGVVVASITTGASMIHDHRNAAGKAGESVGAVEKTEEIGKHKAGEAQESAGEKASSGAITGEATGSVVSSCPSTNDKKEADAEEVEKEIAATSCEEEKQKTAAAAEITASPSSVALEEAVADVAQPPDEHPESGTAGYADDGALLSPAADANPSHAGDVVVSDAAKDTSGTTVRNAVVVQETEEVPLDWEALAREVEAEWVMEGSDGESDLAVSPTSARLSTHPTPATEDLPPPYHAAVAYVETPSAADGLVGQQEAEAVSAETSRDGQSASNALDLPAAAAAAAAATGSHQREDGGGIDGGSVGFVLEDSKEEAEGGSDCSSVVPASGEGGDPIPADEAQVSTHAATTGNNGGQEFSATNSPARVQLPGARKPPTDQTKDDAARSAAALVEASPSPAPIRPPIHGNSVTEQTDGVPVPGSKTETAQPIGGGYDGGFGAPQHPHKESAPEGAGRAGGGCAASCGCVVM